MKFYKWSQRSGSDDRPDSNWYVPEPQFPPGLHWWDVESGRYIENWNANTAAYIDEDVELTTDFPFTSFNIPIYSPRLKTLMEHLGVKEIQYLPLRLKRLRSGQEIEGYHIANYLSVIDCLDRERSVYQIWTKETLLFWEKRPEMLGTFRDVRKAVLCIARIGHARLFRLWGWDMVVVREDVKQAIEKAGITGCVFTELEVA